MVLRGEATANGERWSGECPARGRSVRPGRRAHARSTGSSSAPGTSPGRASVPTDAPSRRVGELHVGWVLGGRAVQDVWIVPGRDVRGEIPASLAFHGSAVRFYDPAIDAWRCTWIDPLMGRVRRFIGRRGRRRHRDALRVRTIRSSAGASRTSRGTRSTGAARSRTTAVRRSCPTRRCGSPAGRPTSQGAERQALDREHLGGRPRVGSARRGHQELGTVEREHADVLQWR